MKLKLISILAAGLLSAAPAFSATVTLDFEGVGLSTDDSVGNAYSSLGVSFGLDALAVVNTPDFQFFSNSPSPTTAMSPIDPIVRPSDAALNALPGTAFYGDASFWYSSDHDAEVSIFSGLDGTGSVLATFTLAANAQNGCSDTTFCHWDRVETTFAGMARSIGFGSALGAGIDNITVNTVPLPAAAWLLLSGLGGFGAFLRRKRVA